MAHLCVECGRPNAPHKEVCMYCGGALPEPTVSPPVQTAIPDDIDQLVRQAMTLGTTHKLQEAMLAHQQEPVEEVCEEASLDRGELLEALATEAELARCAHEDDRTDERDAALLRVRGLLDDWGPIVSPEQSSVPSPVAPEVLLPRYRRRHALVLDGLDDVERAQAIVDAIGVDGVTARMIAIARQPRIALRSDNLERLEGMAATLTSQLGLAAAVVDPVSLRAFGPAALLTGFTHGPETSMVADWAVEQPEPGLREKMLEAPLLVVPGEVVLLRYRAVRSSGRLKHLRDGRMSPSSERRLAVIDLHTESGIVRMLEGATDVTEAPGAVEDSFRNTLRNMVDAWASDGVRVLEARTVNPGGQGPLQAADEEGGQMMTSWPEWEEHSRSCRSLFISPDSTLREPEEDCDSPHIGPL
jgi:hypothetical protein